MPDDILKTWVLPGLDPSEKIVFATTAKQFQELVKEHQALTITRKNMKYILQNPELFVDIWLKLQYLVIKTNLIINLGEINFSSLLALKDMRVSPERRDFLDPSDDLMEFDDNYGFLGQFSFPKLQYVFCWDQTILPEIFDLCSENLIFVGHVGEAISDRLLSCPRLQYCELDIDFKNVSDLVEMDFTPISLGWI